jgi:hypothetical protein
LIANHPTTNASDTSGDLNTASFWKLWLWWSIPAVIGLVLVLYFVDPFIGDWDGMDYTILSVAGYPSSMALGRNLFIFSNHLLFVAGRRLFQLEPQHAYLIFKYVVVAQAPLAVIACWALARKVSGSVYTATIAVLLLVFSPVFVLYGGQVMTDVPSVLVLAVALLLHIKGLEKRSLLLVLLGAGLLGLGVNLRETIGFFFPWLVLGPYVYGWKLGRKEILYVALSCVVFFALALGWFSYWFISDPHYRWVWHGWRESMRQESSRHPVVLANIKPYLLYFFISAPLVFLTMLFAPLLEWRKNRFSPLLGLWLVAFVADLLLFFNYSTTVNWRYFLTGLPGIIPIGGHWILRLVERPLGSPQRAFNACTAAIAAIALVFFIFMRPISYEFIERRAMSKMYIERLEKVPPDAVMISGAQTIAVNYWAAIGTGKWKSIGTGGGWPGDQLFPTIQNYFQEGNRVFIDADPRWWLPCGWQREEIPVIVELENHFRFHRVTDTIFELRPLDDLTAQDKPNLKQLLPENRPVDTAKCPLGKS